MGWFFLLKFNLVLPVLQGFLAGFTAGRYRRYWFYSFCSTAWLKRIVVCCATPELPAWPQSLTQGDDKRARSQPSSVSKRLLAKKESWSVCWFRRNHKHVLLEIPTRKKPAPAAYPNVCWSRRNRQHSTKLNVRSRGLCVEADAPTPRSPRAQC